MASQLSGSNIVHPKVNKLNIKLSKISSARRLYEISSKELEKLYLQVVADESQDHNSLDVKKFPSSQAFHLLKNVTNTVRANSLPVGHTTMEKLSCIRVDAASEMLKSSTWRKFFEKEKLEKKMKREMSSKKSTETRKEDGPNSADHIIPNNSTAISSTSASAMTLHIRLQEMTQNINHIYNNLLYRVEDLWDTLKITSSDRKYYRKSLLSGQSQSTEQCRALASYVLFLQQYKSATMEVLKAIQCREVSVTRFYDLFASLQRKHSRLQVKEVAFKASSNASFMSSDLNDLAGVDASSAWKDELLYALDEVRCNTLDVIKSIQLWRRNLWRPLPFIWNSTNYLSKMKNDMNILESESSQRILNLLPLRYEDLLGVVFFDFRDGQTNTDMNGPESPEQENKADRSPSLSPLPVGSSVGNSVSHVHNIVMEFLANIPLSELREAAMVVLEDEKLQLAVKAEHDALIQQGYFIPSLKLRTKPSGGRKHKKNKTDPPEQEGKENEGQTTNTEVPTGPTRQANWQENNDATLDGHSNVTKSIVQELSTAEMQSIISASFPPYKPFIYDPVDNVNIDDTAVGEQGLEGLEEEDPENPTGYEKAVNDSGEKSIDLQEPVPVDKAEPADLSLFDFFELEAEKDEKPPQEQLDRFSPPKNTNADNAVDDDDENLYDVSSLVEDDGVVRNDKKNINYLDEDSVRMDLSEFTEELKDFLYKGAEEIRFEDSKAEVNEGETLRQIALFLQKYPEIDINIASHTACIGPTGIELCAGDMNCSSLLFSEQRATAIENLFRGMGCRNEFLCRGWGCKHPSVGNQKLIRIFP